LIGGGKLRPSLLRGAGGLGRKGGYAQHRLRTQDHHQKEGHPRYKSKRSTALHKSGMEVIKTIKAATQKRNGKGGGTMSKMPSKVQIKKNNGEEIGGGKKKGGKSPIPIR